MDCLLECHFIVGLFDRGSKWSPHIAFGRSSFLPRINTLLSPTIQPFAIALLKRRGQLSCSVPHVPHLSDCFLLMSAASPFCLHTSFNWKVDQGPDYIRVQHFSDKPFTGHSLPVNTAYQQAYDVSFSTFVCGSSDNHLEAFLGSFYFSP